jgi:hypothetical protein
MGNDPGTHSYQMGCYGLFLLFVLQRVAISGSTTNGRADVVHTELSAHLNLTEFSIQMIVSFLSMAGYSLYEEDSL